MHLQPTRAYNTPKLSHLFTHQNKDIAKTSTIQSRLKCDQSIYFHLRHSKRRLNMTKVVEHQSCIYIHKILFRLYNNPYLSLHSPNQIPFKDTNDPISLGMVPDKSLRATQSKNRANRTTKLEIQG